MDLAEIRKKARQQAANETDAAPALPAVTAAPEEELEEEFSLPEPIPVDPLQQLFPGIELATEEDYIQGLSGQESGPEMETVRWLTFFLGDEEYALSLEVVLELIKPRVYTDLPQVPDYVRGILSLRGEVVPVIDLRRRLHLEANAADSFQRIIVCEGAQQSIGLLVDRITQVVRMPRAAIEGAPLILSEGGKDFVAGVGRYQGRMLILLDPAKVLSI